MKIVKILILFILLAFLFQALLNYYILPVKGRIFLESRLKDKLNRKVHIEKFYYSLKKGFILENLSIGAKEGEVLFEEFIHIEKAHCNIFLLPSTNKYKIIITGLNIINPRVNLLKKENKELNIKDLFDSGDSSQEKGSFRVIITSLKVSGGEIKIYDYSLKEKNEEKLNNIFIACNYSPPHAVKFKLSAGIEKENTSFNVKGKYNLKTKELSSEGTLNSLNIEKLSPYLNLPLKITGYKGNLTTDFKIFLDNKRTLNFKGNSQIKKLDFQIRTVRMLGDLDIASEIKYDISKKELLNLKGDVDFKETSINGAAYVKEIKNLKGRMTFDKKKIVFKDLKGEVLKCPTTFNGLLKDYSNPYLELTVNSKLDLNKLLEALKLSEGGFKDLKIAGESFVVLNIKGELRKLMSLDIIGDISFSDVSIESATPILSLTKANGKINLSRDRADLADLSIYFKDTQYTISGAVTDFTEPRLEFKIISDDSFCASTLNLKKSILHIEKLKGNYFSHNFELAGEISNLKSPELNIYGDLALDLSDIEKLLPEKYKNISKLELKGTCPAALHFKGGLKKWKEADAGFKSSVKRIYLKDLKLDDFYFNLNMNSQKVSINNFSFNLYDGSFLSSGEIDLKKDIPSYLIYASCDNVNLEKLTKDTKLKDKEISGTAFLNLKLADNPENKTGLSGEGNIKIGGGRLLGLPILNSLAKIMGIPSLEKVTFNEASTDFIIKDNTASTQNLLLSNDNLTLKSKGSIDFKRNINFTTNANVSKQTYEKLGAGAQIVAMFFDILGRYFLRVESTGTISKPQHKLVLVSYEELFKKGLIKSIEGILKGF